MCDYGEVGSAEITTGAVFSMQNIIKQRVVSL
jgi:hypothetical protein